MPRYSTIWRNKFLTSECATLAEMVQAVSGAAKQLKAMLAAGVQLDSDADGMLDDYAILVTEDPKVAKKFDMTNEDG